MLRRDSRAARLMRPSAYSSVSWLKSRSSIRHFSATSFCRMNCCTSAAGPQPTFSTSMGRPSWATRLLSEASRSVSMVMRLRWAAPGPMASVNEL